MWKTKIKFVVFGGMISLSLNSFSESISVNVDVKKIKKPSIQFFFKDIKDEKFKREVNKVGKVVFNSYKIGSFKTKKKCEERRFNLCVMIKKRKKDTLYISYAKDGVNVEIEKKISMREGSNFSFNKIKDKNLYLSSYIIDALYQNIYKKDSVALDRFSYVKKTSKGFVLRVSDIFGRMDVDIFKSKNNIIMPVFSPDNRYVVFYSYYGGAPRVMVFDTNKSLIMIAPYSGTLSGTPFWDEIGNAPMFNSKLLSANYSINFFDFKNGNVGKWVANNFNMVEASQVSKIDYIVNVPKEGYGRLFILDVAGKTLRRLPNVKINATTPIVPFLERDIMFYYSNGEIIKYNLLTKKQKTIIKDKNIDGYSSIDGSTLILNTKNASGKDIIKVIGDGMNFILNKGENVKYPNFLNR